MIKFDYSFKKTKFSDLDIGDFFILDEKSETLYLKLHDLKEYFRIEIRRAEEVPVYNCHEFESNRLHKIPEYQEVIKCNVVMTVNPSR